MLVERPKLGCHESQCPGVKRWPRRCYECPRRDLDAALAAPVGRAVLRAAKTRDALEVGLRIGRSELDCLEYEGLLRLREAVEAKRERMSKQ